MIMDKLAVFVDVDGTLVNDLGTVPDSARSAIGAARANGHLVFLATGRSLCELWPEIHSVGFDGIIAAAGGYVEHNGQVLHHQSFPPADVAKIARWFTDHGIDYLLEANAGLYGSPGIRTRLRELVIDPVTDSDMRAQMERGFAGFMNAIIPGDGTSRDDINKMLFLGSDTPLAVIAAQFADSYEVISATIPLFGPNSGELAMRGVHKAAAIELLINHLGIAQSRTVAFGDGPNDLEMLGYVATGVAMGNAYPPVKAVADHVTGAVDEHGLHDGFVTHGLIPGPYWADRPLS